LKDKSREITRSKELFLSFGFMEIIILTFLFVTKGLKLPKRQPEVVNRRINNTMGKRKRTNNDLQNKY
jgi:hypothetical protein